MDETFFSVVQEWRKVFRHYPPLTVAGDEVA